MKIGEYINSQFENPTGLAGKMTSDFMNLYNIEHYKAVKKFILTSENSRILEIGFGNGRPIKRLAKCFNTHIYGIDASKDMVEKAEKVNKTSCSLNQVILRQATAENIPFADDFFDTVYTVNTVYFWSNAETVFDEVRRVLKNGGRFICGFNYFEKDADKNDNFKRYTPQQLRTMARNNGFHDVKVKVLRKQGSFCLIGTKFDGV